MSEWTAGFRLSQSELDLFEAAESVKSISTVTEAAPTPTHTDTAMDEDDHSVNTPTDSSDDHHHPRTPAETETAPWPGECFIIREPIRGLAITLTEGQLRVRQDLGNRGGCHWICVESNGWLGFRNAVSGTYLGHNKKGTFHAKEGHIYGHESFCARRHPNGGYVLLMRHGDEMLKMAISEDSETLIETKDDGTAWEFVKT